MKEIAAVLYMIILISTGLQNQPEPHENYEDYFSVDEIFYETIDNNPIDQKVADAASKVVGRTYEIISINVLSGKLWEKEMNAQLKKLSGLLTKRDKGYLNKSQKYWKKYIDASNLLQYSIFYSNTYGGQGGLARSGVTWYRAEKIKERTFEIMEYRYKITEKVGFLSKIK